MSAPIATRVTNVVLAGLGGQGVIKASDILADAALRAGLDVKKAEVHGMSQRGGSVTSDVRFGGKVLSPMVPLGEADFLVVLAPSEIEVARGLLRPGGVLLAPDLIPDADLPNKRSLNVALLGALSVHLDLPVECLLDAVRAALPERLHKVNEQAFALGRRLAGAGVAAAATPERPRL
jgi:indolepyruvate ferredoxin oxidoreductase, beta subunit